jgi:hypothetical protein
MRKCVCQGTGSEIAAGIDLSPLVPFETFYR